MQEEVVVMRNNSSKREKFLTYTAFIIIFVILIFSWQQINKRSGSEAPETVKTTFAMNTMIEMKVYGENAEKIIDKSFDRVREIENKMSRNIKTSDIYKINQNTGEYISVSCDTFQ